MTEIRYRHVQGGGVPGGHNVIYNEGKNPFITPMRECHAVELFDADWVVDIGAYVGTYSFYAARKPVYKVDAYEPTPATFNILNQVEHCNLDTHNMAVVGDNREAVELHISRGIGVTNSIAKTKGKVDKVTVQAIQYSLAIQNASVVKLDIEGGEYGIPIQSLIHPRLRAIIIDFHPMVDYDWIKHASEIIVMLLDNGFEYVVKPDFSNGWTQAGAWVRPRELPIRSNLYHTGTLCVGCNALLHNDTKTKAICFQCAKTWKKQHKRGFKIVQRRQI